MNIGYRRLALVALTALASSGGGAAHAKVLSQWVEVGPDGTSSVRAITDEACPAVVFDGASIPMAVRSEPDQKFDNVTPAEFKVRGCEIAVPPGTVAGVLDGKTLPLVRQNPQRILMFGDTGCRLAAGNAFQDCNDPVAWPFARIAALAATTRPDLVIHVGDYHYRESACPAADRGCAGSPWGYGWDAWNADFFEPAAPLLAAAPWIMARGNHEDCSRAGEGWFRFMDHAPFEKSCRDLTGVFVARLGDFGVIVVDDGKAADPKGDPAPLVETLRGQFRDIVGKVPAEAWMVSHRPSNSMRAKEPDSGENEVDNHVQEAAFGPLMPGGVRMEVAGHIHFFQAVDFGGVRPPQLVVGTGGDKLSVVPPISFVGADINGRKVARSVTYSGFAYMVWDRLGTLWVGTLFDADGRPINRCRLLDRSLACGG